MQNKKTFLTILLLCIAMTVRAQHVEVTNNVVNMGQVTFDSPAVAEFRMKNKGRRSLQIEKVYTSCGCTTVDYPHKAIGGGDEFTLTVAYNARQMGHFEKQVGVYLKGTANPIMLKVKGIVVEEVTDYAGDFQYTVGQLKTDINEVVFDDVNRGDQPVALIHVLNPTNKMSEPVVMHLPRYLKAEISPSKIAPGRSGLISLTLNSAELRNYGLTQTNVFLGLFPGDKVAPEKEISVSAVLLPDFSNVENTAESPKIQLSTTQLNLGSFGNKKKLHGEIVITNEGAARLDISSLQMFTAGLEVSLNKSKLQPGETAKLKIAAHAKELRQAKGKPRILMITNDPVMPKVVISVMVD